MTSSTLPPSDQQAWAAYRELRLLLDARIARDLEDTDLSVPDLDVLAALRALSDHDDPSAAGTWIVPLAAAPAQPGPTAHCIRVAALADRMRWSRSRLSRQLGRMQRRGLIVRIPCELDGRGDDVEITEAGRRALDAAEPVLAAAVRAHFTDVLTPDQRAALAQIGATLTARSST